MALFSNRLERDGIIEERDLRSAQGTIGNNGRFGAWALMMSSRRAETREERAVKRKRKSLEREEHRLQMAHKLRQWTRHMVLDRF